ncbi:MAG: DUF1566 domain-containing protein [Bacteroidales bacterium]|nr:DUF1566 domain-containing protein [Bacteroidales bacterium]
MSKLSHLFVAAAVVLMAVGCAEKEAAQVPIAPILKDIVMPAESSSIPGTTIKIMGKGFDVSDKITCKSKSGESDFTPEIVAVDDYSISIAVPVEAKGYYEVSVTRRELTTVLSEQLYVAYVILLKDIVLPSAPVAQGSEIVIEAEGVQDGDKVVFESAAYPAGTEISVNTTYSDGKLKLTVPSTVYGVNSAKVVRGKSIGNLGTINVAVDLFAQTAGGIVFYTSDGGIHGLVVHPAAIGASAMNWGPSIPSNFAAGTSADIYKGKKNTEDLLTQVANSKDNYPYEHETPAELCANLVSEQDGISYNDWFLPSQNELVELFKVKASVAQAGFSVPANNYWSSTEFDYSGGWVWAMNYVNFYEATNIVTTGCDRVNWAIGTLAVRQF